MLHKNPVVVAPAVFQLIKELQSIPELNAFYLAGGTALALMMGHRSSVDIDLFAQKDFKTGSLKEIIGKKFSISVTLEQHNTLLMNINSVKVDLLSHDYPYVKPPGTEEGISHLSMEDISAMKLNTIINSGQRLKDFIDVYYLLEHFTLNEILGFFQTKYAHMNPLIALRALNYFNDIDPQFDPPKLLKPLPLQTIIARIQEATLHANKRFG